MSEYDPPDVPLGRRPPQVTGRLAANVVTFPRPKRHVVDGFVIWDEGTVADEKTYAESLRYINSLRAGARNAEQINRLRIVYPEYKELLDAHAELVTWAKNASISLAAAAELLSEHDMGGALRLDALSRQAPPYGVAE